MYLKSENKVFIKFRKTFTSFTLSNTKLASPSSISNIFTNKNETREIEKNKTEINKIPRIWTSDLLKQHGYQDIEVGRDFFVRTDGYFGPISTVDKTKNTFNFTASIDPRRFANKSHTHIASEITDLQDALSNIGKLKIGNEYLDVYVVPNGQASRYKSGIVFEKY